MSRRLLLLLLLAACGDGSSDGTTGPVTTASVTGIVREAAVMLQR